MEVRNLTGEFGLEIGCIEPADHPGATDALVQIAKKLWNISAQRIDRADACDDNPLHAVLLNVGLNVVDGVLDGRDFLGNVVGNGDVELFLEFHDQLDSVERISTKIILEAGIGRYFRLFSTQFIDDDRDDFRSNIFHDKTVLVIVYYAK